ncbi:MAG TPA: response regulator [Planctomycetota bacterium]|nr:response regulator [Planctomycetota bacterium]
MSDELRILFVEDSPADMELEERALQKAGVAFRSLRVETKESLVAALHEFKPTLILSDFSLPTMDGLSALRTAREHSPGVPFIFVSGTIGEERAIESLKNGATDYIVKDRLGGFVVKVQRALREAEDRAVKVRVEEQLRQSQKMEAVGRLAGGVAHDFNNLLTVINGYSQLMLTQLTPDNPLHAQAEEILRAGERAASLTRQLLMFSRRQILSPATLNLNDLAKQTQNMLRRLIGEDIELRTALDPALGSVKADPGQIEQVIMNLAVNARDAMPNGGRITIETGNVVLDEDYASQHPGTKAGPHVMLAVSDTGTGMDEETQSHLFEPFFTTKEPGKGTGLGLSTVYGIAKQNGGSIWVYSELGKGSVFKIYFPRTDEAAAVAPPKPEVASGGRGTETILLVEDSESVRKLASAVLASRGYKVLTAEDGDAALRVLGAHSGPLDLLLTDVVLPRLSGPEIAFLVNRARPGTRVLFMSGYTDRGIVENGILESGISFLQKPFGPDALVKKVREVLSAKV